MNIFIRQRGSKTDRNTDYIQYIKTCTFTIMNTHSQDMVLKGSPYTLDSIRLWAE